MKKYIDTENYLVRGDLLNKVSMAVEKLNHISGAGGIEIVNNPFSLLIRGISEPANPVKVFQVKTVNQNTLYCYDSDDNVVTVAKPYKLRQKPFHNKTIDGLTYSYGSGIQRTVEDSEDEETQIITPCYIVRDDNYDGDEIYAIRIKQDMVGINADDEGEDSIEWLDLNLDGRAWANENE